MVDDEDYDFLIQWKWSATFTKCTFYAKRSGRGGDQRKSIMMHREIINAQSGVFVDHKDHNGLNNQRSNLRICTPTQNMFNKVGYGRSKYNGVSYDRARDKWVAAISIEKKQTYIGRFKTEVEAAIAFNELALKHRGEFANLNVIPPEDMPTAFCLPFPSMTAEYDHQLSTTIYQPA